MSTVNKPLKYLFRARYDDGTWFDQPADDASRFHGVCTYCHARTGPYVCHVCGSNYVHTKSAFADIVHEKLASFELIDSVSKDVLVSVDLKSGLFNVLGITVKAHPQHYIPQGLKLIYFREVTLSMNVKQVSGEEPEVLDQDSTITGYYIGWESTIGPKQQCVLGF